MTGVAATQLGGWGLLFIALGATTLFALTVRTRFRRGKTADQV